MSTIRTIRIPNSHSGMRLPCPLCRLALQPRQQQRDKTKEYLVNKWHGVRYHDIDGKQDRCEHEQLPRPEAP